MEYLAIAFSAVACVAALAVWQRINGQGGATQRVLETLQRQGAVLDAVKADQAQARSEIVSQQATFRAELNAVLAENRRDLAAHLGSMRQESSERANVLRHDLEQRGVASEAKLDALTRDVATHLGGISQQLAEQLDRIRADSAAAAQTTRGDTLQALHQHRVNLLDTLEQLRTGFLFGLEQSRAEQSQRLADVTGRLDVLTATTEQRLDAMRGAVDGKLQEIREDNGAKLEQMRATVDEKLQSTLEQRLGETFRTVGEQLERVQLGLGEMRTLATGVGDLKRVLTNVKVRGNWGEVQLGALLEQVLTPEQYATNVAVRPNSGERVEYAIRLPGRAEDEPGPVWLPIDAKFPQDDYQRLVAAHEAADPVAAEAASRALDVRIRGCAKDISTKYIDPPHTTEFGIMFLPTEGLYAEVARRPGLIESLQREHRVVLAGPSTLAALLNSLQMGFRTLAIQKRTSEVWNVLGRVKTEFGKFQGVLHKVQKKLQEAGNTIDEAQRRTRVMGRQLRTVESTEVAPIPVFEPEIVPEDSAWENLLPTSPR